MSKSQRKKNANAKKLYEVRFFYMQRSVATEIIEAKTLAEAKRKADEMSSEDVAEFDPVYGELSVESVEQLKEGGRHE